MTTKGWLLIPQMLSVLPQLQGQLQSLWQSSRRDMADPVLPRKLANIRSKRAFACEALGNLSLLEQLQHLTCAVSCCNIHSSRNYTFPDPVTTHAACHLFPPALTLISVQNMTRPECNRWGPAASYSCKIISSVPNTSPAFYPRY